MFNVEECHFSVPFCLLKCKTATEGSRFLSDLSKMWYVFHDFQRADFRLACMSKVFKASECRGSEVAKELASRRNWCSRDIISFSASLMNCCLFRLWADSNLTLFLHDGMSVKGSKWQTGRSSAGKIHKLLQAKNVQECWWFLPNSLFWGKLWIPFLVLDKMRVIFSFVIVSYQHFLFPDEEFHLKMHWVVTNAFN